MSRPEVEEFQLYFSRIRPIYHQLFNIAHVITGSCERAEYCLQYSMLDCWAAGDANASRHGFREGLRSSVTRAAIKNAGQTDSDWNGLQLDPENSDPLLHMIAQESTELQRILALRYGCGLSVGKIIRIVGGDSSRIQTLLHRFEARTRRKLSTADRRRYDALIVRCIRGVLSQPSGYAPEMSSVFRTFQSDAASISRPSRLPARILKIVLASILAVFCVLAFWLTAVLLQPAVLEDSSTEMAIHEIAP